MLKSAFEMATDSLPESLLDVVNMRKKEVTESTDRLRNLKTYLLNHNALPGVHTDPFNAEILFTKPSGSNPPLHSSRKDTARAPTDRSKLSQSQSSASPNIHANKNANYQHSPQIVPTKDNVTSEKMPPWFMKGAKNASPEKQNVRLPYINFAQMNGEHQKNGERENKPQRNASVSNMTDRTQKKSLRRTSLVLREEDDYDENIGELKSALLSIFQINKQKKYMKNKKIKKPRFMPEDQIYEDTDGSGVGPLLKKIDQYLFNELESHFVENLEAKYVPGIESVTDKYRNGKDPFEFTWNIDPSILGVEEENIQKYMSFKKANLQAYRKKFMTHRDIV